VRFRRFTNIIMTEASSSLKPYIHSGATQKRLLKVIHRSQLPTEAMNKCIFIFCSVASSVGHQDVENDAAAFVLENSYEETTVFMGVMLRRRFEATRSEDNSNRWGALLLWTQKTKKRELNWDRAF
jgi:hypothetical protein